MNEKYAVFNWTTKDSDIVLCLDHQGNEIWRLDFGEYDTAHGNGNSPMIHNGTVYYTHCHFGSSAIYAIDLESGNVKWKRERNSAKPSHSTPRVRLAPNGEEEIIFTSDAHGVFAIDPKDFKVRWESGDKTFKLRCVLSPIFAGNYVLGSCGSGGGGNQIVAIQPPQKLGGETKEAWRIRKAAPYVPTGVMFKGNLFLVDDKGIATCMDPISEKIHWQQRLGPTSLAHPSSQATTSTSFPKPEMSTSSKPGKNSNTWVRSPRRKSLLHPRHRQQPHVPTILWPALLPGQQRLMAVEAICNRLGLIT